MPFNEAQVLCKANQWTPIAPYMDRRQALRVQCPQIAAKIVLKEQTLTAGIGGTLIAANPLRRFMAFQVLITGNDVWIGPSDGASGSASIKLSTSTPGEAVTPLLTVDESWTDWAGAAWEFNNTGPADADFVWERSTLQCATVILSTFKGAANVASTFGLVPNGHWISPNLSAGPGSWELVRSQQADMVIQEWFAWPVGTADVTLDVLTAFDDAPADDSYGTITVAMPSLTPHGKAALNDLLAAAREGVRGDVD